MVDTDVMVPAGEVTVSVSVSVVVPAGVVIVE